MLAKYSRRCNCRVKAECPLNGACLVRDVVYKDRAISRRESKYYKGTAGIGKLIIQP